MKVVKKKVFVKFKTKAGLTASFPAIATKAIQARGMAPILEAQKTPSITCRLQKDGTYLLHLKGIIFRNKKVIRIAHSNKVKLQIDCCSFGVPE